MQTQLYKGRHEVVERKMMDMTMSMVTSEVPLLVFLMMRSAALVLVGERYDGAQDEREKER